MRSVKATPQPKKPGKPDGWAPTSVAVTSRKCPTSGHLIDCRDLAEVIEHEGPHQAPSKS
jgi:hypothetical protein